MLRFPTGRGLGQVSKRKPFWLLTLSFAVLQPFHIQTLKDYCFSYFSHQCDQIPDKKQLKRRRVCFGSQFRGTQSRVRRAMAVGAWGNLLHYVLSRKKRMPVLSSLSHFSFIQSRTNPRDSVTHVWDGFYSLVRNSFKDRSRGVSSRWFQIK